VGERQKRRKIEVFQLPNGDVPGQQQQQQPANELMEDKSSKKLEGPRNRGAILRENHSKQLQ